MDSKNSTAQDFNATSSKLDDESIQTKTNFELDLIREHEEFFKDDGEESEPISPRKVSLQSVAEDDSQFNIVTAPQQKKSKRNLGDSTKKKLQV